MLIKSLATDDQLTLQLLSSPSGWMEMLKIAGGPTVAFAKSPEEAGPRTWEEIKCLFPEAAPWHKALNFQD